MIGFTSSGDTSPAICRGDPNREINYCMGGPSCFLKGYGCTKIDSFEVRFPDPEMNPEFVDDFNDLKNLDLNIDDVNLKIGNFDITHIESLQNK